ALSGRERASRPHATRAAAVSTAALRANRIKHGVLLQHDCPRATTMRFADTVRGVSPPVRKGRRVPAAAAPSLKKISRGLLTVEKTVIRFRPAAVSCGRE